MFCVPKIKAWAARCDCAAFFGKGDFLDFPVGSDCAGCYRIDVAIIVMSGESAGSENGGGGKSGAVEPRCGQPRRIKEDLGQGAGREKYVGTF